MGRWGEGLFEGDTDLDVASYISEDAGIELYNYHLDGPTRSTLWAGRAWKLRVRISIVAS